MTLISDQLGRAHVSSAVRLTTGFPQSVAASQRHLSPLRRERKLRWTSVGGNRLAPFLYPVDRGRGGSAQPRRSGGRLGTSVHSGHVRDPVACTNQSKNASTTLRLPSIKASATCC